MRSIRNLYILDLAQSESPTHFQFPPSNFTFVETSVQVNIVSMISDFVSEVF